MTTRICGTCTACCTVLGVPELQKPPFKTCSHLSRYTGCGIYKTRPHACAVYKCAWLQSGSVFPKEMRPDRCGVVFDTEGLPDVVEGHRIGAAREVWEGAASKGLPAQVIDTLRRDGYFIVVVHPRVGAFELLYPIPYSGAQIELKDETMAGMLDAALVPRVETNQDDGGAVQAQEGP